jgi:hypothetical protein
LQTINTSSITACEELSLVYHVRLPEFWSVKVLLNGNFLCDAVQGLRYVEHTCNTHGMPPFDSQSYSNAKKV